MQRGKIYTERIFTKMYVSVHKEELIKFGSIRYRIRIQELLKDISTLQDREFSHNVADISGKTYWILMKILSRM